MSESQAIECTSIFSGIHITSLDDIKEMNISGVSLYEKDPEKKEFSIKQVREMIENAAQSPYEGKNLFILRDYDRASLEAMNASLKILEESPSYLVILLVVSNPENLLETIRSRSINIFISE
jgi:DNA polymerase III gamma/tau subunit